LKGIVMKIKLLVSRSGADGAFSPGDEITVSDNEAVRMIEAGQAEPLRTKKVERAVKARKSEKAIK
jgi:hypothetical protein